MTRVLITYHEVKMTNDAEDCILVTMTDKNAQSLIEGGANSYLLSKPHGAMRKFLEALIQLQGYDPARTTLFVRMEIL